MARPAVQVSLNLSAEDKVVTVPERAVQAGQRGSIVWVVGADRTAVSRVVVVDRISDGIAVISSGIAADETVVSDGQLRLSKGATITTNPPAEMPANRAGGK